LRQRPTLLGSVRPEWAALCMNEGEPVKTKRTLIVHRYFWPENISVLPLMFRDVAELHCKRGDTVEVVTGSSGDFAAERTEAFGGAVVFDSFPAPADRGRSPLGRMGSNLRLLANAIAAMLRQKRDILYTVSYPPLLAGVIIGFARLTGRAKRQIFYVQDNFTYRIGLAPARSVYRWLMGRTVAKASATLTLSAAMKAELLSYVPPKKRADVAPKIYVLPNFAIDGLGDDMPVDGAVRDIIYAGNHGPAQNLEHFLRMLAHPIVTKKPSVAFFGEGSDKARLQGLTRELDLDPYVTFHDAVGRDEIRVEMARSRFGLVGAMPDLMRYAFPSKLAGYAAVGIPSLLMCADNDGMAEWLADTGFGLPLDAISIETGARQIAAIFDHEQSGHERHDILGSVDRYFGRSGYLDRLNQILDEL
jgi:glycosyltransferase involved in cell wall biosynthesis